MLTVALSGRDHDPRAAVWVAQSVDRGCRGPQWRPGGSGGVCPAEGKSRRPTTNDLVLERAPRQMKCYP